MTAVPKPKLPTAALCPTFQREAARIWTDFEAAYGSGIARGEETITDDLLLSIQRTHPMEVLTFQFRKVDEARIGADWEWWLTNGRLWLGLLLQAKRLDPKSHKYPHIKHRVGSSRLSQIDLLLQSARNKGIDALYFFYNYSPDPHYFDWNCGSSLPDLPQLGCAVAHAVAVKQSLDRGGAGLPKMSKVCLPMKCLVCCPVYADPDPSLPGRAHGVSNHLRDLSLTGGDASAPQVTGPREYPPSYVKRLLDASPDQRGRVIEELRKEVGSIGSLTVIKEPPSKE